MLDISYFINMQSITISKYITTTITQFSNSDSYFFS